MPRPQFFFFSRAVIISLHNFHFIPHWSSMTRPHFLCAFFSRFSLRSVLPHIHLYERQKALDSVDDDRRLFLCKVFSSFYFLPSCVPCKSYFIIQIIWWCIKVSSLWWKIATEHVWGGQLMVLWGSKWEPLWTEDGDEATIILNMNFPCQKH